MAILPKRHHPKDVATTDHPSSAVITKSILKVKTLDESIRSTESSRRSSIARKVRQSVSSSVRNIFSLDDDLGLEGSIHSEKSVNSKRRAFRSGLERSARSIKTSVQQSRGYLRNASPLESLRNVFSSNRSRTKSGTRSSVTTSKRKSVQFDALMVREYKTQVDVNPGVSRGAALSLSWEYENRKPVQVEKYEDARPHRKKLNELKLTPTERERRLKECGVSRAEMDMAIKQTNIAKRKRRETLEQLSQTATQEKLEKFKRGFKRRIGLRKSDKQEEEDLWKNAEVYFLKNC